MRFLYVFSFLLALSVATSQLAQAQCSTCTYTVSTHSSANYSLNTGQTLCIAAGVNFSGNIDLNGGTLCNSGNIIGGNLNFNSGKFYNYGLFRKAGLNFNGEFHNYGTVAINGDLNINGSGSFYNYAGAELTVSSSINNNHIFINNGNATVNGNYSANSGTGNKNENTGHLSIGGSLNINKAFTNTGVMTVGGALTVNSNGAFTNSANASINVSGNYTNNATTSNDGAISIGGNFVNNSSGIFVNNNSTNLVGNFTNNGSITGDVAGCNSFSIYGNSVVQNSNGSIGNTDFCSYGVPGTFTTNYGSLLSNFTYCTCSSTITPLPIVLKSFNAVCNGQSVELKWITATEINNQYFTLYQSTDLKNWEVIHVVDGAGNSNSELEYSYTQGRKNGITYYRLEQTDYDGTSKTFAPISISCDNDEDLKVVLFPNPVEENYTIAVQADKLQTGNIEIFDFSGRKVAEKTINLLPGVNNVPMERNGLGGGTYLMRILADGEILGIQKFLLR